MIYEDDGAEALALDEEFDIAIPFSVSLPLNGGKPEIRVFPSLKKYAVEFLRLFGGTENLFSSEAIQWMRERCTPFLVANGYTIADECGDYYLNYRILNPDRSFILKSTRRINTSIGFENLTGYDFEAMTQYGHICFGTIEDDKIVSAACTNYSCELAESGSDKREIEIGVETAEIYRGKGYAKSNISSLAAMLADRGYSVLFECESKNAASKALIKSLSGKLYAMNFCIVGRKS